MAHRSVHRATGQLVKTCDEISDPESSAAFTSTRSCSGNAWRTTLLPERAELTKGVAADLPNHVAEHSALLCLSGTITRRPSCAASRRES
jgi:hypothetical protein